MKVCSAASQDAQAVYALVSRAYADERDYAQPITLQQINESLDAGHTWLVLEDETQTPMRILGCVCGDPKTMPPRIGLLATDLELKHQRRGHELMRQAEERLRSAGCERVSVGVVSPKAAWLVPYYRELGYVETCHTRQVSPRLKRPHYMIVMFKTLSD